MIFYLASPYSDPDQQVRERRFREVCKATAALLRAGRNVFSPIAHSHPLAEHGVPTDWPFWQRFDRHILERCDELWVLMLDGWQASIGVHAEIQIACSLNLPVRYLSPGDTEPCPAAVASEARILASRESILV